MIPGEYFISDKPIQANVNRYTVSIIVQNTGDRPIQVGSHVHFFEVNKALYFQRKVSYGYHLNIPSGTSVRFEPGDTKTVTLVEYAGEQMIFGFSGLVNGYLKENKENAFKLAAKQKFMGM